MTGRRGGNSPREITFEAVSNLQYSAHYVIWWVLTGRTFRLKLFPLRPIVGCLKFPVSEICLRRSDCSRLNRTEAVSDRQGSVPPPRYPTNILVILTPEYPHRRDITGNILVILMLEYRNWRDITGNILGIVMLEYPNWCDIAGNILVLSVFNILSNTQFA